MIKEIKADIQAALEKDPAARNKFEILMTYSGVRALIKYRIAHSLYLKGFKYWAKRIAYKAKIKTGVEIHPAATLGCGIFIDHGTGVVIGETAEIGNDVTIYQGVTLGGTGKDVGKRHPTIKDNVMISAGAKVLGPVVIGENCKIGAGSVVLKDVPANCTIVGVPGRIVRQHGKRVEMDQKLPDPMLEEITRLNKRIEKLEDKLGVASCKYSIANEEINMQIDNINEDKT